MIFQILDANYAYDSGRKPLVQLFGTTPEGQSVTVKAAGFRPYFYASAIEGCLESAADDLKAMGLEVEVLERFEPIGYQKKPKGCSRSPLTIPKR
jgi:DNA polymerase I